MLSVPCTTLIKTACSYTEVSHLHCMCNWKLREGCQSEEWPMKNENNEHVIKSDQSYIMAYPSGPRAQQVCTKTMFQPKTKQNKCHHCHGIKCIFALYSGFLIKPVYWKYTRYISLHLWLYASRVQMSTHDVSSTHLEYRSSTSCRDPVEIQPRSCKVCT